jgi:hypothetical protein
MGHYRGEQAELTKNKDNVAAEQGRLANQMQQITNQMQQLANQMQQLITQHQLRIEVPVLVPRVGNALQRPIPVRVAQNQQATLTTLDPMSQYEMLKAEYARLQRELATLNNDYEGQGVELRQLEASKIESPSILTGLGSALAASALTSTGFPVLIAWVAWITGVALVTVGACWLAFVSFCNRLMDRLILKEADS